jgi:hypothetical protein
MGRRAAAWGYQNGGEQKWCFNFFLFSLHIQLYIINLAVTYTINFLFLLSNG